MKIPRKKVLEAVSDANVICWSDLIVKLQLLPLFEAYKREHNEQYSITKVFMGNTLMKDVETILKARFAVSKDKRVKYMHKKQREWSFALDALQSCPATAKTDIDFMELQDL